MGNVARKAIFFDIDGTISSEETGIIPESAVRAIRKARENGHLTFINSGRTLTNIEEKYKQIGFHGYVCGCGTSIFEGRKCIYKHRLPREVCLQVMHKAKETRVTAVYEAEEATYFDDTLPMHPVLETLGELMGITPVLLPKNIDEAEIIFDKFCVWLTEEADFETFFKALQNEFDFIDRGGDMYEVVPKGVSKATGIQRVMEYYQISLEDCYALGDSTNDLQMLKFVQNSIAMGNCMEEVLPYCAYQTERVENDGLEKALKHYGII